MMYFCRHSTISSGKKSLQDRTVHYGNFKYKKINHDNHERAAIKTIQAFKAQNAYFRAVVIPQSSFDLTFYGKKYEPENIREPVHIRNLQRC